MTGTHRDGTLDGARRARVEGRDTPSGIDTQRPRFGWEPVAAEHAHDVVQTAARVRVTVADGPRAGDDVWDSGWTATGMPALTPATDLDLRPLTRYEWWLALRDGAAAETREQSMGTFGTGLLGHHDARWIATPADDDEAALPLFRTEFDEARPVIRAHLAVVGLGQYALTVNGMPVADGTLAPAWSDARHRVLYDTHDVTSFVEPGLNAIGVALGNGFHRVESTRGRYTKFVGEPARLMLYAVLRLQFADGTDRTIVSGDGWTCAAGPVTFSSIFGGEDHDARLLPAGWDRPGGGAGFSAAETVAGPAGSLAATGLPAVAVVRTVAPVSITRPSEGVAIVDFGENLAGRPKIALTAVAGTRVTMLPGELLLPDGAIDQQSSTGGAPGYGGISYTYTSAGGAGEVWSPRFTYTGFRYLQIEGVDADDVDSVVAEVLQLDVERSGSFSCSEPLLTGIHGLIDRAVASNLVSVLTDCPHREKLGWLEQYYLNAATVLYTQDAALLFEKMVTDIVDAQLPDGMVPSIAPEFVAFVDDDGENTAFRDSPEWGSALILAPWEAYRFHGDPRILEDAYPHMLRYLDYLQSRVTDGVLDFGLGDWYDLGPDLPGEAQLTSRAFTATATLLACLQTLARIGQTLGLPADATRYADGAERLRADLDARFRTGDRVDRGSQTAIAMSLALDIAEEAARPSLVAALLADIASRGGHVSAGDIGFHYVVRALADSRADGTLASILLEESPPSYAAQLRMGATTLTEAWDAQRSSSQNHFMLGHAEAWLFGGLGGIRPRLDDADVPLVIAPALVDGIRWVEAEHRCPFGPVSVSWRVDEGRARLDVSVPAGARARLELPASSLDGFSEGGVLRGTEGALALESGRLVGVLGSGTYRFEFRPDPAPVPR